ncbi:MAG: hypothetical protein PQJ50_12285 [Spirochaetales bacterium]|nr:hypothetical protein [Spirochaetales bacterium]
MTLFAVIFLILILFIVGFQFALILGAPWGEFTMGGIHPGRLPAKMRLAAAVQILILIVFGAVTLSRAGLGLSGLYSLSRIGIWAVTAFFVFGTVMNLATSSRKERLLMGPLNIVALVCSFLTAIS